MVDYHTYSTGSVILGEIIDREQVPAVFERSISNVLATLPLCCTFPCHEPLFHTHFTFTSRQFWGARIECKLSMFFVGRLSPLSAGLADLYLSGDFVVAVGILLLIHFNCCFRLFSGCFSIGSNLLTV